MAAKTAKAELARSEILARAGVLWMLGYRAGTFDVERADCPTCRLRCQILSAEFLWTALRLERRAAAMRGDDT